jgi:hypothetical protein
LTGFTRTSSSSLVIGRPPRRRAFRTVIVASASALISAASRSTPSAATSSRLSRRTRTSARAARADCWIALTVRRSMRLERDASRAMVPLRKAKQLYPESPRRLLRCAEPGLEQAVGRRAGSSKQPCADSAPRYCCRPGGIVAPALTSEMTELTRRRGGASAAPFACN